jgi:hypothetical protein
MALDMGKMYGPLPLGAWAAVVAGGLGLALYTRKQGAAPVSTDPDLQPEDTSGVPGVGVGGSGQWTNVNPPAQSAGDAPPATNDEWARQVIDKMTIAGFPADVSNSGINKFINQESTLTVAEYTLVKEALRRYGSPPQPVPGPYPPQIKTIPTPVTPPKPKPIASPVQYVKYVVRRGDTPASIGAMFRTNFWHIYRANQAGKRRADGTMGYLVTWRLTVGRNLIIPTSVVGRK